MARTQSDTIAQKSGAWDFWEHHPHRRVIRPLVVLLVVTCPWWIRILQQLVANYQYLYWQHPRVTAGVVLLLTGLVLMLLARWNWNRTLLNFIIGVTLLDGLVLTSYWSFSAAIQHYSPGTAWAICIAVTWIISMVANWVLVAPSPPDGSVYVGGCALVVLGPIGITIAIVMDTAAGIAHPKYNQYGGHRVSFVWPRR